MEVQQKIVYSLMIPEMVHGMIYDAQIRLNLFASASMFDFEYNYPNVFVVFCLYLSILMSNKKDLLLF